MTSTEDERLADLFGKQAAHSEHQRGEHIHYRLPGEGEYEGIILWCAESSSLGSQHIHQHYVVQRDGAGDSFPDVAFPVDVIQ